MLSIFISYMRLLTMFVFIWSLLTLQWGGGREMRGDEKYLASVLGGTKKKFKYPEGGPK